MVFYLQRHVDQDFDEPAFVRTLSSDKHIYAVLWAADYDLLAPRIATHTCIIDRRSMFEVKLRQVLARQPLPELLLITNQCR